MTRKFLYPVFIFTISVLLIGCAAKKARAPYEPLKPGAYAHRVNEFLVILDASASMGEGKLARAKDFLTRMNQSLPELRMNGALRIFGQPCPICPLSPLLFAPLSFRSTTTLRYGPTEYTRQGFQDAIDDIGWPGGNSPMTLAIDAAAEDLKSSHGQIAVIIVSDGKEMDDSPLVSAQKMANQYGDRLCIYTIVVGNDPAGEELLNKIALTSLCGFSVSASSIDSEEDMAAFVREVFFYQRADADRDGVTDDRDKCPGTLRGAKVDSRGCWVVDVRFDSGKWDIKEWYEKALDETAEVLKRNPLAKVEVQGHTDNRGKASYNMWLSRMRAREVMSYLIYRGVDMKQLWAKGYGFSKPRASNDTSSGRAKNRRIEFKVLP